MRVPGGRPCAYEYVVLRCVPRVDREEFVNVAVVLHCRAEDFLDVVIRVDPARLRALAPGVDVDAVADALTFATDVCAGSQSGGLAARQPLSQRFGFLKAPRSTVVQPGPVHGGVTHDPATELARLGACLL